jgi:hypothetical protein
MLAGRTITTFLLSPTVTAWIGLPFYFAGLRTFPAIHGSPGYRSVASPDGHSLY